MLICFMRCEGERSYIEMAPVLEATANVGVSVLAGQKCRSGIADGYETTSSSDLCEVMFSASEFENQNLVWDVRG